MIIITCEMNYKLRWDDNYELISRLKVCEETHTNMRNTSRLTACKLGKFNCFFR